jgi:hypothetical protein
VKKVPFYALAFKVYKENRTTKKITFIFTKVEMGYPKMKNFMPISKALQRK